MEATSKRNKIASMIEVALVTICLLYVLLMAFMGAYGISEHYFPTRPSVQTEAVQTWTADSTWNGGWK